MADQLVFRARRPGAPADNQKRRNPPRRQLLEQFGAANCVTRVSSNDGFGVLTKGSSAKGRPGRGQRCYLNEPKTVIKGKIYPQKLQAGSACRPIGDKPRSSSRC